MARGRSIRGRRDDFSISNRRLPSLPVRIRPASPKTYHRRLIEYEDRRLYNPLQKAASPVSFQNRRVYYTPVQRQRTRSPLSVQDGMALQSQIAWGSVPVRLGFQRPESVVVCARRSIRKQVMHALGHAGKGGQKKPVFNELSKISCRRT